MDHHELHNLDARHVWHPYTRSSVAEAGLPVIVRGENCWLTDIDGRRYFDGTSSWWCCAPGHSRPEIVEAIRKQAGLLQHSILGNLSHPPAIELASRLSSLLPGGPRHIHYCSDGSTAVETALKICLHYSWRDGKPTRDRFLSLRHAYHGDTVATMSLGFLDVFHKPYGSLRLPVDQIPVPPRDASEDDALAQAESVFAKNPGRIAGLIVEPLCQAAAGMHMHQPSFLRKLWELCRRHGTLFIADEIATGFGRTGSLFAHEQAGIDPDIVCLGKALTGGTLPVSAAAVHTRIQQTFTDSPDDRTFYHGHTFGGNPLGTAAALAAIEVYRKIDAPALARNIEHQLRKNWSGLETSDGVKATRFLGAIGVIELDGPNSGARARAIQTKLLASGVIIRPLGPIVYLFPPLTTPLEDLDSVSALVLKALANSK